MRKPDEEAEEFDTLLANDYWDSVFNGGRSDTISYFDGLPTRLAIFTGKENGPQTHWIYKQVLRNDIGYERTAQRCDVQTDQRT